MLEQAPQSSFGHGAKPDRAQELRYLVGFLGCCVHCEELDSIILRGLFPLRIFCDSLNVKSICVPSTATATSATSPSTRSRHLLNTRGGDPTTSLANLFPCLTTQTVKTFFIISNLNLPSQFKANFFLSSPCKHSRKDFLLSSRLTTTCFQVIVGSDEVPP